MSKPCVTLLERRVYLPACSVARSVVDRGEGFASLMELKGCQISLRCHVVLPAMWQAVCRMDFCVLSRLGANPVFDGR